MVEPEKWRPVVGFEGIYEVSDLGRVRSLRFRNKQTDRVRAEPKILALWTHCKVYCGVTLRRDGKSISRLVHQLVLEAFVGPRPPGTESAHGPAGPSVNRPSNLRWATSKENTADIIAAGNMPMGERHYTARLTAVDVLAIRDLKGKRHYRDLAEDYGVAPTTIRGILNGYNWKHVV